MRKTRVFPQGWQSYIWLWRPSWSPFAFVLFIKTSWPFPAVGSVECQWCKPWQATLCDSGGFFWCIGRWSRGPCQASSSSIPEGSSEMVKATGGISIPALFDEELWTPDEPSEDVTPKRIKLIEHTKQTKQKYSSNLEISKQRCLHSLTY